MPLVSVLGLITKAPQNMETVPIIYKQLIRDFKNAATIFYL